VDGVEDLEEEGREEGKEEGMGAQHPQSVRLSDAKA
jgi:hypothetical protein